MATASLTPTETETRSKRGRASGGRPQPAVAGPQAPLAAASSGF